VAFGSIMSTLAAPMLIAAIGIIFRGAAYALRGASLSSHLSTRTAENLLGIGSMIAPFALGTAVGAWRFRRRPSPRPSPLTGKGSKTRGERVPLLVQARVEGVAQAVGQ
jgi:hypothetical protein